MKSRTSCSRRFLPCVLCGVLLLGVLGCGGGKKGIITGTVTYDGKKLLLGSVTFVPAKGSPITAEINEDGVYTATGVPVGDVKVTVSTHAEKMSARAFQGTGQPVGPPKDVKPPKDIKTTGAAPPPGGEKVEEMKRKAALALKTPDVPGSYGKPETSGITYTVTSGKQDYNIELKKK